MSPLSTFLARHALSEFRHRQRLFSALRDGTAVLVAGPETLGTVACRQFLRIFQARRENLEQQEGAYARSVREDLTALCTAFSTSPNAHCQLWAFTMQPGFDFSIFERVTDHRLLGCLLGLDRHRTDEATWERFFG